MKPSIDQMRGDLSIGSMPIRGLFFWVFFLFSTAFSRSVYLFLPLFGLCGFFLSFFLVFFFSTRVGEALLGTLWRPSHPIGLHTFPLKSSLSQVTQFFFGFGNTFVASLLLFETFDLGFSRILMDLFAFLV